MLCKIVRMLLFCDFISDIYIKKSDRELQKTYQQKYSATMWNSTLKLNKNQTFILTLKELEPMSLSPPFLLLDIVLFQFYVETKLKTMKAD